MTQISGKIVWITGASSGIGEATAIQLAKEGAKLVLSARRESELQRVKNLSQLPDEDVLVLPMDVEKPEVFPELVKKVLTKFNRIDILFNNAGISQRGSVADSEMEVYKRILDINFFGVIALTKAVLPTMIEQKSGHIVVTSSVSGKLGTPMRSGYCASKHALHGFFDSLRSEIYLFDIQVLLVCPGYINTNISVNSLSADGRKYGKMDTNQANGLSVDKCAEKIISGIKNNKTEIYMGGKEILGVYLKRFFPRLLNKILRNQIPK
jgi:short-subunit dehydrogenase